MIYLYVPFYDNENNQKLLQIADSWCNKLFKNRDIRCKSLSPDSQINTSTKKIKIYVLGYETAVQDKITSEPNGSHCLDANELVSRLLKLGLPSQNPVEIKLCIKCKEGQSSQLMTEEILRSHFQEQNYNNPELAIRLQYSHIPFPGEVKKLAYRQITGTINFFEEVGNNPDELNPISATSNIR